MVFRNAFQILTDNFNKVYKLLLYRLVVLLFTGAIFLAFFIPNVSSFLSELVTGPVGESVKQLAATFLRALLATEEAQEEISACLVEVGVQFSAFLSAHSVSIALVSIGTVLVYFAFQFLRGIGDFVVGDMINTRMCSYAEVSFFSSLVKNIGIACRFLIIYVPIVMLFDVLILLLCYFVFFFLLSFLPGLVALFLSITAIICAQAAKFTLTSNLMPAMIEGGMKLGEAVKWSFHLTKVRFGKLYSSYIVYLYIALTICLATAVFTLGSGLLLALPAASIWLISIRFVNFYTQTGRKYFITYDTIVLNADKGNTEKFFENNEMYDKTKTR